MLALKRLPYKRVNALAHLPSIARRGGIGKVPALELDGELVVDSTDIAYTLDRRYPERPIVPSDPEARAMCHVFEDWADEALYFTGLYYHFIDPAGRRAASAYFKRTLIGRVAFLPYLARVERQLRGQGLGRKSPSHVRADLERTLDAIEALLEGKDFLVGGEPYLCDLALAAQLVYLTRAASLAKVLETRPETQAYLERVRAAIGDHRAAA